MSYKKTFLTIGFFSIVIFVFYLLTKRDNEDSYDFIRNQKFWGKIDTVIFEENGRMQPTAILMNSRGKILIENNMYKEFKKGDTLFKEKGSFEYHLIKNGDTITFYQQSGNEDIK